MTRTTSSLAWVEHPLRELIRLTWPMVVQLLSVSVMTFVDTLFISRLGWIELAAAGLGGICSFTVLSFGIALFSAARVEVGRLFGRGDVLGVERELGAFVLLCVPLGILSVLAGLFAAAALPWLTADRGVGELAGAYAAARSFGFPAVLLGSAIGQWRAAQGDSQSPMRAAVMANLANIPLNALLIFGFGWGLSGAAIATVCAGFVEAAYLLWLQNQQAPRAAGAPTSTPGLHLAAATYRHAWAAFLRGMPTGLERVLDMMAFAAVPLLLARVGAEHVAAHQIVLQLLLVAFLPSMALSDALSVLVSQAIGAGEPALARRIGHLGLLLGLGYGVLCAVGFLSFPQELVGVFSRSPPLVEVAVPAVMIGALLQLLNAAYNHYKGMLRGLSVFHFVAAVAVGCAWLLTPPLTYLMGVRYGAGVSGAWWALCVEVTVGSLIVSARTRRHPLLASARGASSTTEAPDAGELA